MLSHLTTDPKIRVMEKKLKSMNYFEKRIPKLSKKEVMGKIKEYTMQIEKYDEKISHHALQIIKETAPSRIDRCVAAIVAYSELKKKAHEIIIILKTKSKKKEVEVGIKKFLE